MSRYKHLESEGIEKQKPLSLNIHTGLSGEKTLPLEEIVENFAGGGFFGSVILMEKNVLKTAQPDPFHELLRTMNWPTPFPSRSYETAARLDYLSGKISHLLITKLTNNEISVPEARGYTRLSKKLGYAQLIERMYQRGPTFMDRGKENKKILEGRETIWEIGKKFGLEQAAQVHPDNPFGKPNMRLSADENGKLIWLDTLPAFRHTTFVRPFFRYRFHNEVRKAMGVEEPTYNTIHTEKIRAVLRNEPHLFSPEDTRSLVQMLHEYDMLKAHLNTWLAQDPKTLYAQEALELGLVEQDKADQIQDSQALYTMYRLTQYSQMGTHAFLEIAKNAPILNMINKDLPGKIHRFITDGEYRSEQVLEHSLLWGLKKAEEDGLISHKQFQEAISFVPASQLPPYIALLSFYVTYSRLADGVSLAFGAYAAQNLPPIEAATASLLFWVFHPGIVRAVPTALIHVLTKIDLKHAAIVSLIPMLGGYTAIPYQLKKSYGEAADSVFHHNMRALVATLSKLRAGGGWGSDLEEKIWNTLPFESFKNASETLGSAIQKAKNTLFSQDKKTS